MNNTIEYIEIEKLHPHPDNPRKDLGDLSELVESIKKNGVLQNLTVVPATGFYYGDYTVIIGHRRLAAATEAGLTTLPCVVLELTKTEQVAAMLAENMQRSDLTLYEQAQGMQMMLDLGETVESVAEKTGFSETTVRRRVKLATLDAEIFKEREDAAKNEGRQIALGDYERLFEIEDEKERNAALKSIGTVGFTGAVNSALYKQKTAAKAKDLREASEQYGREAGGGHLKFLGYPSTKERIKEYYDALPEGAALRYRINSYGVELYRTYTPEEEEEFIRRSDEEKAAQEEREKGLKKARRLDAIAEKHFSFRLDFVRETLRNERRLKACADDIISYAAFLFSPDDYWSINAETDFDGDIYARVMQVDIDDEGFIADDVKNEFSELSPIQRLFAAAYIASGDHERNNCRSNFGEWRKNEKLEELYNLLACLGYETSDEEYAILNGTHEAYKKDEDEPI